MTEWHRTERRSTVRDGATINLYGICSCGWRGPSRTGSVESMSYDVAADIERHLA